MPNMPNMPNTADMTDEADTASTAVDHSDDAIRAWLAEHVATYLQIPTTEVQPHVPLAEYGLDSVFALSLCGDIEDRFAIVVEPTLAWDYPTIGQIAGFIGQELATTDDPAGRRH